MEVGPDGQLWIADWYNFIIQHNPIPTEDSAGFAAEEGQGNAHINPLRDAKRGRIYRLVATDAPQQPALNLSNADRSEEHTSELQSRGHLVCRLLLEKKKRKKSIRVVR